MATTMFFEATLKDKKEDVTLDLEFGRSSFYRDNLIYLRAGDTRLILDEKIGRELYEAMQNLGQYLGYDKPHQ